MTTCPYYYTWNHQPLADVFPVECAEDDEFVLSDGRRIYDFLSTSFQASFGHSHPRIRAAIHQQLEIMPIASPKSTFELKQRVSQRFLEFTELGFGKVFYTLSGSEAVENALKMARQMTGRTKVVAREKSYHGASLGALSVTGDWRNAPHFTIDEETLRIPEPADDPEFEKSREIIQSAGPGTIAAIIVETISGANGVAIPGQSWFDAVQATCQQHDIMFIADEVLCGFGRTGPSFAYQHYGLRPDFVCAAKGISGGYVPFGAVWTGKRVVAYYDSKKMACGLTNYGHPLGLAALGAVLDVMADGEFQENKAALESLMTESMTEIASWEMVAAVRQRGLLAAVELAGRVAPSWEDCFEQGLHLYSKDNMLIVAPPFISTTERLSAALAALQGLIKQAKTL